jgi:periplasmic divalent cation tolerance protein
MTDFVIALTTVPEAFDAESLARDLVGAGLAACVNILPAVQSIYLWEGTVESSREQQLVIKTSSNRSDALWAALRARHPYDVPEFVVLPITGGNPAYLSWIRAAVGQVGS